MAEQIEAADPSVTSNGTDNVKELTAEERQAQFLFAARVRFLKAQQEFLGIDPKEEDDNQLFVKRLIRYSIAQGAVIAAQNTILQSLGVI